MQEQRKLDHITMTMKAQKNLLELDTRFNYEPMLSAHPHPETQLETKIFGKTLKAPFWISSMTGGTSDANLININLARVCHEFGLGMGLGSCRPLLESKKYFSDFDLRSIIGDAQPFFANLGIAQIEKSLEEKSSEKIFEMIHNLEADGLIIHINPLQEYLQLEGDTISRPPIEILAEFLSLSKTKIIVKEVGQGMGPKSLLALLELPIAGIELAGFGGTNFSEIELLRGPEKKRSLAPLTTVGHSASEMIDFLNNFKDRYKTEIIISGGVKNFLDAHFLLSKSKHNAVVGQAKNFLAHARNYEELKEFVQNEIAGLKMAQAFLSVKESNS